MAEVREEAIDIIESFVIAWVMTKSKKLKSEFKPSYCLVQFWKPNYYEVLFECSVFTDKQIVLSISEDALYLDKRADFEEIKEFDKYAYSFNDGLSINPYEAGYRCAQFFFYDIEKLKQFLIDLDRII
ncbi:hypothetical protein D3C71_1092200 [compost metagenome]